MFQALSIMELPPDPHNNPHLNAERQRFSSGIQPIFEADDDTPQGKRKASLTAAEGAKAQKIASIAQSDYMQSGWFGSDPMQRPEEFYRPEPLDYNAPEGSRKPFEPLPTTGMPSPYWRYSEPTEFMPPEYYAMRHVNQNPELGGPMRTETQGWGDNYDHRPETLAEVLTRPWGFDALIDAGFDPSDSVDVDPNLGYGILFNPALSIRDNLELWELHRSW